jgi:hypothetical protein
MTFGSGAGILWYFVGHALNKAGSHLATGLYSNGGWGLCLTSLCFATVVSSNSYEMSALWSL